MKPKAKLSELIYAMEMQSEDWVYRFDRETAKVASVERSAYDAVEEDDDAELDENDEEVVLARAMVDDSAGRFLDLPDKFDFHEYRQMERFIGTVEDGAVADELWRAIKGRGAFRYFKDTADRHGVLDDWYRFRDERAKQFAIDWAESNDVPYEDDTAKPVK